MFESRVCKLTSHFSQIFANITNCKKICGIDSVDSSKTLYIRKLSDLKCKTKGGNGVFREFADFIIDNINKKTSTKY